jgi:hypothetical protein
MYGGYTIMAYIHVVEQIYSRVFYRTLRISKTYTMGTSCKPCIFLGNITVTFPFLYY